MKTKTVECYQFLNALSLEECCHMVEHLRGCFGYYRDRAAENREHARVKQFAQADTLLADTVRIITGSGEADNAAH